MPPLTDRQKRFVREYLVDYNAVRAAKRAGYSDSYAQNAATRLTPQPQIRAAIDAGEAERNRVLQLDTRRIIDEIARIAFANIRNVVHWSADKVEVRDQAAIPDDALAAVAEFSRSGPDGRNVRIKLYDKGAALEALARYAGLIGGKGHNRILAQPPDYEKARAALRARIEQIIAEREEPAVETEKARAPLRQE